MLTPVDIAAMGEGTETVTATATDTAGNVSAAGSYPLIVDTTAPVFTSGGIGAVAMGSLITATAYGRRRQRQRWHRGHRHHL